MEHLALLRLRRFQQVDEMVSEHIWVCQGEWQQYNGIEIRSPAACGGALVLTALVGWLLLLALHRFGDTHLDGLWLDLLPFRYGKNQDAILIGCLCLVGVEACREGHGTEE